MFEVSDSSLTRPSGRERGLPVVKVVITGRPGVGKSTIFAEVVENLKRRGYSVCGFFCPEIRIGGVRKGFKIVSIGLPIEGVLSYVCGEMSGLSSLTVGKYCIKIDDAISVGAHSLEYAVRVCDIIALDEVGPMELKVKELEKRIWDALYSAKPTVAVVHVRLAEEVRRALLSRSFKTLYFVVTESNRGEIPQIVLRNIFNY
ncbi:MAG: nucleoside-triphosphatase [Sulfolobales archaeon]|nr:nucleoside-triphosphatase [Sulfolobales archaeon]MCX8208778.1 nucleoside-triphosphatase [Sulfolobales archaeon]MDW8010272.1 nucleoside-triphosphatase [Sulfolobales archaeon]